MKKDVFDYELTREEQFLAHAIKYAVVMNGEMAERLNKVISSIIINAYFRAKRNRAVEHRREIDFHRLLELTKQTVEMCWTELVRINSVQDEPLPEITHGVEMFRQLNMKTVLQDAGTEFYDFLVDCCK